MSGSVVAAGWVTAPPTIIRRWGWPTALFVNLSRAPGVYADNVEGVFAFSRYLISHLRNQDSSRAVTTNKSMHTVPETKISLSK